MQAYPKPSKKKKKLIPLNKLLKKTQIVFNRWIRNRDEGLTCISCNGKYSQAGHYIAQGSSSNLRFNEDNVNGQCLTKHSNLRMFNGLNKSISKIKINDEIWGFNEETFQKEISKVLNTNSFIPNKLYKVELDNGDVFFATPDHRVVANGKWIEIKDMLHSCTDYDIIEI